MKAFSVFCLADPINQKSTLTKPSHSQINSAFGMLIVLESSSVSLFILSVLPYSHTQQKTGSVVYFWYKQHKNEPGYIFLQFPVML